LAQEQVLLSVAVEISDAGVEGRGELRCDGQRARLEPIAPIEEHHVVHGRRAEPDRRRGRWAEHLVHRGIRVGTEGSEPLGEAGKGQGEPGVGGERRDASDSRVFLREQPGGSAAFTERAEVEEQRPRRAGVVVDVPAPAGSHDVEPAVAVQVAGRQSIPAAVETRNTRHVGRGPELTAAVQKDADRPPLDGDDQVRPAVAVDVGELGCCDHPDPGEEMVVRGIADECAVCVAIQSR
jgi:hypothetical protein